MAISHSLIVSAEQRGSPSCQWECRPCSDRLALVLFRKVGPLVAARDSARRPLLVSLNASPPEGTTTDEMRSALAGFSGRRELVVIEGAKHGLPLKAARQLPEALAKFLNY